MTKKNESYGPKCENYKLFVEIHENINRIDVCEYTFLIDACSPKIKLNLAKCVYNEYGAKHPIFGFRWFLLMEETNLITETISFIAHISIFTWAYPLLISLCPCKHWSERKIGRRKFNRHTNFEVNNFRTLSTWCQITRQHGLGLGFLFAYNIILSIKFHWISFTICHFSFSCAISLNPHSMRSEAVCQYNSCTVNSDRAAAHKCIASMRNAKPHHCNLFGFACN